MQYSYCFGGDPVLKTLKVGTASIAAGTWCMTEVTHEGEVTTCTTTSAVKCMGLAMNAGVYAVATEATVLSIINPLAVYRGKFSGAATESAALALHTNTGASTTVLSAANISANDHHPGLMFCLTGANAGLSRVVTSWIAATSATTSVQFPANIAVGDVAILIPTHQGWEGITLTTALTQVRADIASGAGVACTNVGVELEKPINTAAPVVYGDFLINDHALNPID